MKKETTFWISIVCVVLLAGCQSKKKSETAQVAPTVITENLRFCESTYPYDGGVLIANFGTEQMAPLNKEGKGYIAYCNDGKTEVLIPADGNLNAPKGLFIKDNYLFVCDVNKIVVYNLAALQEAPQTIALPEGDAMLNDLVASGNTMYVSVTNTGRIFTLDITNPAAMSTVVPIKWLDIAAPNGLLLDNGVMYVASYPVDGKATEANVIYEISDLANPVAQKFITTPGLYDGIALSNDKKTMYISNWDPANISAIDMQSREITPLDLTEKLVGPGDISVIGEMMYVPDLSTSKVICLPLN